MAGQEDTKTNPEVKEDKTKGKKSSRIQYQIKSLKEIRKAQKAVSLLIPRAAFIRVVRDISERLCKMMSSDVFELVRWQFSALACIQEAAEDFLIDFLNDSYIAAAHAHRVILMNKDFSVVSRLRYRFDKFLRPIPTSDRKAFDILNTAPKMPLNQKPMKVEDVTHLYSTRTVEEKRAGKEHEQ